MAFDLKKLLDNAGVKSVADLHDLRDTLSQVLTIQSREPKAKHGPSDVIHLWSNNRKDHTGKLVPRSCLISGVLAAEAGEDHGRQATPEEESQFGFDGPDVGQLVESTATRVEPAAPTPSAR